MHLEVITSDPSIAGQRSGIQRIFLPCPGSAAGTNRTEISTLDALRTEDASPPRMKMFAEQKKMVERMVVVFV